MWFIRDLWGGLHFSWECGAVVGWQTERFHDGLKAEVDKEKCEVEDNLEPFTDIYIMYSMFRKNRQTL